MSASSDRIESIFAGAVALPIENRVNYLDSECVGDPIMRKHVEALLRAHERSSHLLDHPVPGGPDQTVAYAASEKPGTVVAGRYKLLESIGEGGMGTVWVAEQTEPVRRKVALKLIKAGMDSKSVLARFEAERQALAMMDHPNIAKVLDGGLTDQGRPYFVMEYVKGVPITEYCDAARLSVQERLTLFMQVCQAVQHAHQKGIIHRDLKPSNILVAPYDDKPVPKIIDFGLAKAMHQSLTERTLHTAHESVLGTPLYMSPEQAQLNNLDVDTRSDIYSLGVLLYELLTGTTPLEKQRFKQAAWDEVRRIIREEEPQRPSARLSSTHTLPSLAAGRHTEPLKLTRLVRGELDWIVMKALEKDRTRRYETANGFARDIQRYLSDEVVEARPASTGYRLRKFVSRHKGQVIAASLVLLALLAGIMGTTWGLIQARQQEQLALTAQQAETERAEGERLAKLDAVDQKEKAEQAAAAEKVASLKAQKRLTQIEKANELLGSILENLDPNEIAKKDRPLQAILVEKLDKAVAQLEGESIGDPLVVAAMQSRFGYSLIGLGEPDKAIMLLEKARVTSQDKLGPNHPNTVLCMNNLAMAYQGAGKPQKALLLWEETLKVLKTKFDAEYPLTLNCMNNLAMAYLTAGKLDLALPLLEETLKLQKARFGLDDSGTLTYMNNLALSYQNAGKLDLALPLLEETLIRTKAKFGPDHPSTFTSMNALAGTYFAAGKLDLALPLFEATLKLRKAKLGPEHPDTLRTMDNLANVYAADEKLNLALPLFEATLTLKKVKLGPDHPETLTNMNNLAAAYWQAKQLEKSIPLFEETLKLSQAKFGRDHMDTIRTAANLGVNYKDAGRLEQALPLLEEGYRASKQYPLLRFVSPQLLACYVLTKKPDQAAILVQELMAEARKEFPKDSPELAGELASLSLSLLQAKAFTQAEPLLRECMAIREKQESDDWKTFNTKSMLGGALLGQKKHGEAETLLLKGYEGMKQREKTIPAVGSPRIPETLDRLIQLYTETNKPDEAKKWQAEKDKLHKEPAKK